MKTIARRRRSLLYVPASNKRAMTKAPALACDAIIYDLEDAVTPAQKPAARQALVSHFSHSSDRIAETIVRINGMSTQWGEQDLAAAIKCQPDAVLLPKVEQADQIASIEAELERSGTSAMKIWAMIETPLGIVNLREIASTANKPDSRLDCLVVGTNDLAKESGLPEQSARRQLEHWLMQIILYATAFKLDVVDGVYNDFRDLSGFEEECRAAKNMAFTGKTLIHPAQIDLANKIFSPDTATIAQARQIVSAFALQQNADKGVISIDGKMVERLHLEMAKKTLARLPET